GRAGIRGRLSAFGSAFGRWISRPEENRGDSAEGQPKGSVQSRDDYPRSVEDSLPEAEVLGHDANRPRSRSGRHVGDGPSPYSEIASAADEWTRCRPATRVGRQECQSIVGLRAGAIGIVIPPDLRPRPQRAEVDA